MQNYGGAGRISLQIIFWFMDRTLALFYFLISYPRCVGFSILE